MTEASARKLDSVSKGELADRLGVLARNRVARGDVATLDRCAGSMSTPEELERCPKEPLVVGVLGVADKQGPEVTVQVIVHAAAPSKIALSVRYVMKQDAGTWHLLRQQQMMIIE